MGFHRFHAVEEGRLGQPSRAGLGLTANFSVFNKADDAAVALTVAQVAGGFIAQTGVLTADRIFTTPTAALLLAEWPEMDVGDSYSFVVSCNQVGAFDIILAGGTDVTLAAGAGNLASQASRTYVLVKTSATTMDLF